MMEHETSAKGYLRLAQLNRLHLKLAVETALEGFGDLSRDNERIFRESAKKHLAGISAIEAAVR